MLQALGWSLRGSNPAQHSSDLWWTANALSISTSLAKCPQELTAKETQESVLQKEASLENLLGGAA
jgi:hypothetical protein